jgi:hypothetical protein
MNEPYSGTDDGLDRALRRRFPSRPLIALTLEVNQALPAGSACCWLAVREALAATFAWRCSTGLTIT